MTQIPLYGKCMLLGAILEFRTVWDGLLVLGSRATDIWARAFDVNAHALYWQQVGGVSVVNRIHSEPPGNTCLDETLQYALFKGSPCFSIRREFGWQLRRCELERRFIGMNSSRQRLYTFLSTFIFLCSFVSSRPTARSLIAQRFVAFLPNATCFWNSQHNLLTMIYIYPKLSSCPRTDSVS